MKILVYGWYHQSNIGDDLFIDAFENLFPDFQFIFRENITADHLKDVDAVFFGGGSFLLGKPRITDDALQIIKSKPIFYIGVGVESDIHPIHLELMTLSKFIAMRSPDQLDRVKTINQNSMWIPDLVYSLQDKVELSPKINKSVLVLSNISVVPNHNNPYWMHASWVHFKSEFAQFLDVLSQQGYQLNFLSMCRSAQVNDDWASGEIIGHMTKRNKYILLDQPFNIKDVTKTISQYDLVITQRFHGIVLAEMTKTPYIAIHHHDKLKTAQPSRGEFLSYYNCSKQVLIDSFDQAINMKFDNALPIESDIYKTLVKRVRSLL